MNKVLTSCSFLVVSLIVIAAFMTATTYTQLVVAILLYPPLAYFGFKAFPRKSRSYSSKKPAAPIEEEASAAEKVEPTEKETVEIGDIDKRAFLKLIGGVGISLFLFSLFNKKAEGLFFRSLPGSSGGMVALENINGNKIDPAQNQPTDGYNISDVDDDEVTFIGYTNKDGAWFIMKEEETGAFRYAKGDFNFPGNWSDRKNLKYDYFSAVF